MYIIFICIFYSLYLPSNLKLKLNDKKSELIRKKIEIEKSMSDLDDGNLKLNLEKLKEELKESYIKFKEVALIGHLKTVWCLTKMNSVKLASGSKDNSIKIWDLINSNTLFTLSEHTKLVSGIVKMNENKIVSASYDKSIKIWDLSNEKIERRSLKTMIGHNDDINCLIDLSSEPEIT